MLKHTFEGNTSNLMFQQKFKNDGSGLKAIFLELNITHNRNDFYSKAGSLSYHFFEYFITKPKSIKNNAENH